MKRKIYYIEDDITIGNMLKLSLETINEVCPISVEVFLQYETFREALDESRLPDLIMIDLMLPTKDGYDILVELKNNPKYRDIPVIIVSAKLAEYERYICSEAGAVGYFTKPFFGLLELNSAIKTHMNLPKDDTIIVCGNLALDSSLVMASRGDVVLELTQKEFELLRLFMKNNNVALSKQQIYREVWRGELPAGSRTVDMHVNLLRRKVFSDDPSVIKTITKFGYKFEYRNN